MNLIKTFSLTVCGLVVFFGLAACSPEKVPRSDLSGRGGTGTGGGASSAQGPLAECTRVSSNNANFRAELSTYYMGGMLSPDYIQMNISIFPASLLTSTAYVQMFRWKEPQAGQRQMNSIPVRFYYVNKLTGATLNSQALESISRSSIEGLISEFQLGMLNITASNFFNNYYVVMTGMELQWEALLIAFYDSAQGASAIGSTESLLPPFLADPTRYSFYVPVPSLQNLHPLRHLSASGASEQEFKRLADEICLEFFGQIRNTASTAESKASGIMSFWVQIKASVRGLLHNLFGL